MTTVARLPWRLAALTTGAGLVGLAVARAVAGVPGPGAWAWQLLGLLAAATIGYRAGVRLDRGLRREHGALLERAKADADQAAQLRQRGEDLSSLVDSVTHGLLSIGADGRITFLNPAARSLLGLPESAEGQAVAALIRSVELRQLLEHALRGERTADAELTIGEQRVLVTAQPYGEAGRTSGIAAVVSITDLTQLRRLEDVRRDFVANVSHELKTPLTSIRGYVETLRADDLSPELRRQFMDIVERNAHRLQRIVEELLDLSMIESGGWQPQAEVLDVASMVADTWLACQDRAQGKGVEFHTDAADTGVLADPHALRQVLSNLFDNALRHTPPGGRIEVRVRPTDALVTIEVSDTGSGIPHEALPRIFERFFRVDPARSRAEGGTGLGLAIVRHRVEAMGGDVAAASEIGKGTTIQIRLPAAP